MLPRSKPEWWPSGWGSEAWDEIPNSAKNAARIYHIWIRTRMARFTLEGLLLNNEPIWLRDIYVPLRLGDQPLDEREDVRDGAELDERIQETGQDLLRLMARHRHLIISGLPGSGKTTLARWLSFSMTEHRKPGPGTALMHFLPVHLTLRELPVDEVAKAWEDKRAEYEERGKELPPGEGLRMLIQAHFQQVQRDLDGYKDRRRHLDVPALAPYFDTGRAVILLDGLDELGTPARRRQVAGWLAGYLSERQDSAQGQGNQPPPPYTLVTSRPLGLTGMVRAAPRPGATLDLFKWFSHDKQDSAPRPGATLDLFKWFSHDKQDSARRLGAALVLFERLSRDKQDSARRLGATLDMFKRFSHDKQDSAPRPGATPDLFEWFSHDKQDSAENVPGLPGHLVHVLPFHMDDVATFTDRWYRLPQFARDDARQRAIKLREALGDSRRADLRALARRPAFLTMMTFVHGTVGELPDTRARLYDYMVDAYIQVLDQWKQLDRRQLGYPDWPQQDLIILLSALAWKAQVGAGAGGRTKRKGVRRLFSWTREALLGDLRDVLTRHEGQLRVARPEHVEQLLVYFRARTGLLVAPSEERVEFGHLSFQEYLAARYLYAQATALDKKVEVAERHLFPHLGHPGWREVATLFLAIDDLHTQGRGHGPLLAALDPAQPDHMTWLAFLLGGREVTWSDEERRGWVLALMAAYAAGAAPDESRDGWRLLSAGQDLVRAPANASPVVAALGTLWAPWEEAGVIDPAQRLRKALPRESQGGSLGLLDMPSAQGPPVPWVQLAKVAAGKLHEALAGSDRPSSIERARASSLRLAHYALLVFVSRQVVVALDDVLVQLCPPANELGRWESGSDPLPPFPKGRFETSPTASALIRHAMLPLPRLRHLLARRFPFRYLLQSTATGSQGFLWSTLHLVVRVLHQPRRLLVVRGAYAFVRHPPLDHIPADLDWARRFTRTAESFPGLVRSLDRALALPQSRDIPARLHRALVVFVWTDEAFALAQDPDEVIDLEELKRVKEWAEGDDWITAPDEPDPLEDDEAYVQRRKREWRECREAGFLPVDEINAAIEYLEGGGQPLSPKMALDRAAQTLEEALNDFLADADAEANSDDA